MRTFFRKADIGLGIGIILVLILAAIALDGIANKARAANVTLAWDANDPVPDGYNVFMLDVDGGQIAYNYATPKNTELVTSPGYTIENLIEGQTYRFIVRAVVNGNSSGDSNEVEYTVPMVLPQIVIPKQVSNVQWDFESKTLSWEYDGTTDNYVVSLTDSNAALTTTETTTTTQTFDTLTPGETYTATIAAVLNSEKGPDSQSVQFTIPMETELLIYPKQVITLTIKRAEQE